MVVLAAAEVVPFTALLLAAWLIVPLHAGGRLIADVRYGLAWWSASRAGARHARELARAAREKKLQERDNRSLLTGVTQGGIHHNR
ncbi:hypothetical protein [Nonomuraea wenchangensis]|uniref:hypothetical protein n=1 Tax=Nonomuraea wenchangensis TaxID=568860 RepID=UPI0011602810|nr:hypothetical protein [Nonomuraea wenchangensis]